MKEVLLFKIIRFYSLFITLNFGIILTSFSQDMERNGPITIDHEGLFSFSENAGELKRITVDIDNDVLISFQNWNLDEQSDFLYIVYGRNDSQNWDSRVDNIYSKTPPKDIFLKKGNIVNLFYLQDAINLGGGFEISVSSATNSTKSYVQKPSKEENFQIMHGVCDDCPEYINTSAQNQTICEGECTYLNVNASFVSTIEDKFNGSINNQIWDFQNGEINQSCGSKDGSTTLWFGSNALRNATTKPLDVQTSCSVSFDLKIGTDPDALPSGCEDADLATENVLFQYFNGTDWITIDTYDNNGLNPGGPYDQWTSVCASLPQVAKTSTTQFRWVQPEHSGQGFDQWAIDNVIIETSLQPTYQWSGPSIFQGGDTDKPAVCPTAITTYTVTATAGNQTKTATVDITVIPKAAIGGEITSASTFACRNTRPNLLQLVNYTGVVQSWQYSPGCTGVYQPLANSSDVYSPEIVSQTTCYRAVVKMGQCLAYSDSIKIKVPSINNGVATTTVTTICPGEEFTLTLNDYVGEIVGWEFISPSDSVPSPSEINVPFPEFIDNQQPTIKVSVHKRHNCWRAIVKYTGCEDSTAGRSDYVCVTNPSEFNNPRLVFPKVPWYECQDSIFSLTTFGLDNDEILYWEVKKSGESDWTPIPGTEGKKSYTSPVTLKEGDCYRLIYRPAPPPNSPCPLPEFGPLEPYCVTIYPCEDCGILLPPLCYGDTFPGPICRSGVKCGTDPIWEIADNPDVKNCNDLSLNWLTLPQSMIENECVKYKDPVTKSFCLRVQYKIDGNYKVTVPRLVEIYPIPVLGSGTATPDLVCAGTNSGRIIFTGFDPVLKITKWDIKHTDTLNAVWKLLQIKGGNEYNYSNLTVTTAFRVHFQDSVTQCEYVSDSIPVKVIGGLAGRLEGDKVVCPDSTGTWLILKDYAGTVLRWEKSIGSCNGPWGIAFVSPITDYFTRNLTQSTCFRVVLSGGQCPEVISTPAFVDIQPPPNGGRITGSTTVCIGEPGSTLTLVGNSGTVVRWESSTDCVNFTGLTTIDNTLSTYDPPPIIQNTCYRAVVTNGGCFSISNITMISVIPQTLPGKLSGINRVCYGNSSTLTLSESTGNIVRWEKSIDDGNTWTSINHLSKTYTTDPLTQTTCYRVYVKSTSCPEAATSKFCVLVDSNAVGGDIGQDISVCINQSPGKIKLTNYLSTVLRWELDEGCIGNWVPQPNSATDEFSPSPITQKICIRVLVQRSVLCPTVYSNTKIIDVIPISLGGDVSPNHTLCVNDPSQIMTLQNYRGTILRWEKSTDNGNNWIPIPNTNGKISYSDPLVTTKTYYRVIIKNFDCPEVASTFVIVTANNPQPVGNLNGDQTLCINDSPANIRLTGNVGAVLFWEKSIGCTNIWETISNTGTQYSPGMLTTTSCFRVVLNGGTCPQARTLPVKINIDQLPIGGDLTGSKNLCDFTASTTFILKDYSGTIKYWQKSEDNGLTWVDFNNPFDTYTVTVSIPTLFRVVIKNGTCPDAISDTAQLKLAPPSQGGNLGKDVTICFGETSGKLILSNSLGQVERWEISKDKGNSWYSLGKSGTNEYTSGPLTVDTWFRVLVSNEGCTSDYSKIVKVFVKERNIGGILQGGKDICADKGTAKLELIGSKGSKFEWEASTDNGQSWQIINENSLRYDTPIIFNNIWYRVKVSSYNCPTEYSSIAKINILKPSVGGELSQNRTICIGGNSGKLQLNNYFGNILRWEISKNGINWISIGKRDVDWYLSGKLTVNTWFRAVVQSGTCPIAYSNAVKITVNATPISGVLVADNYEGCEKLTPNLKLSGYGGEIMYWETSEDGVLWNKIENQNSIYTAEMNKTTFIRVKIGNGVCNSVYSNVVKIIIHPKIEVGNLSKDATICFGGISPKLVVSNFSGKILRWEISKDSIIWKSLGKEGYDFYQSGKLTVDTWFRVVLGSGNCEKKTTNPIKITVIRYIPNVNVGDIIGEDSVCLGKNSQLTLQNYQGNISHWEYSLDNWSTKNVIDDGNSSIIFANLSGNTKIRAVLYSPCGNNNSKEFEIKAILPPALTATVIGSCNAGGIIKASPIEPGTSFKIQPEVLPANNTGIFENVPFGPYVIYATNLSGCDNFVNVIVSPTPPDPPLITSINGVTQSTAFIRWTRVIGNDISYVFRYRIHFQQDWNTIGGIRDTFLYLNGLEPYTYYDVEVAAICGGLKDTTDWSTRIIKGFKTNSISDDCLKRPIPVPSGVYIDQISANYAMVHWNSVLNTPGYIVAYGLRRLNPNTWSQYVICSPDTFFLLQNLSPIEIYGVRVRTNCTNCTTALKATDLRSNWCEINHFQTLTSKTQSENLSLNSNFSIYPNPNSGKFELRFTEMNISDLQLQLFDMTGKVILPKRIIDNEKEQFIEIDLGEISGGVYLLKITNGIHVYVQKILIK